MLRSGVLRRAGNLPTFCSSFDSQEILKRVPRIRLHKMMSEWRSKIAQRIYFLVYLLFRTQDIPQSPSHKHLWFFLQSLWDLQAFVQNLKADLFVRRQSTDFFESKTERGNVWKYSYVMEQMSLMIYLNEFSPSVFLLHSIFGHINTNTANVRALFHILIDKGC